MLLSFQQSSIKLLCIMPITIIINWMFWNQIFLKSLISLFFINLFLAYIFVYSFLLFNKLFVKKNQRVNLNFPYYLNLYYL